MTMRAAILALLALLVAACGQPDKQPPVGPDEPNPLLWEIARADGTSAGWLIGTIHALPDGVEWRTPALDNAVAQAGVLAVEIAELDDGRAVASAFKPLAYSPGQPPLLSRVPPDQRESLTALVADTPYGLDDFRGIESWGAALILAQSIDTGADATNGIDRALIRDFAGRRVVELEGAVRQFAVFDGLSERAQRAMLGAIVEEADADKDQRQRSMRLYLQGDEAGLTALTREGLLADDEIREALLERRNAAWMPRIARLLESDSHPLIAVGAAHMVGKGGLVALIEAKGYTVRRVR
ncbi:TraB/GumN family protein [Erythrobacter sp. YJ-T3-07]|nr:TraB/GumN family protein [Erythrobacter sp. YJ-T3-07]